MALIIRNNNPLKNWANAFQQYQINEMRATISPGSASIIFFAQRSNATIHQ